MKELEQVEEFIREACAKSGRDPSEVRIVAVTKTHGPEVVEEARAAGLSLIGENKVQEAMWKKPLCDSRLSWHLIGHLQTNKVRHALATFDYFHSIDSAKLLDTKPRAGTTITASVVASTRCCNSLDFKVNASRCLTNFREANNKA